jgi:hypothetical protein
MTDVKTDENHVNTLSHQNVARLLADRVDGITAALTQLLEDSASRSQQAGTWQKQLDHIDEQLHQLTSQVNDIHVFITEHKPALAKALSLLDPGKGVRGFLTGGGRGKPKDQ